MNRKPNKKKETPETHGEVYRNNLKITKPKVYKKIQNYLNDLNSRERVCSIDIAYRWQCNMNCTHCFTTMLKNSSSKGQFNIHRLKKFCNEADEMGVFAISLQGGEPLLWKDLPDIIDAMDPKRFNISIVTNALLLDDIMANNLKDYGIDRVCISIDSGIQSEHDKFRNFPGSFNKSINAVEACLKCDLTPHIHTVVTHQSLYSDGFNKIVNYAKSLNLGITVLIAIPAGKWKGETDLLINESDAKYIHKLHTEYPLLRRDITPVNGVDTGCRAVTYALYITSFGEVLPCPFLHFTLGNVFETPLSQILKKGYRIKEFREYSSQCLAGEDTDFICKYMKQTFDNNMLPIQVEDVFNLEKE